MVEEYVLASVNSKPLPVRVFESGDRYQAIIGGTLTLIDETALKMVTKTERRLAGVISSDVDSVAGTYTYGDNILVARLGDSSPIEFRVVGDLITLDFSTVPDLPVKVEHVFAWKRAAGQQR